MKILHNFLRSLMLPLNQIDSALPASGKIVDVGCGEGVISTYIAKNNKRNVVGIDTNKSRLPQTNSRNLKFAQEDARNFNFKQVKGVVLSDVLHHMAKKDQQKTLELITQALTKNSILVIKEIDTKEKIRSALSRFWDFIFYPKEKIYFNNSDDLVTKLKKLNYKIKIDRPCRLFPGSTTLFVCTKL